MSHPGSKWRPQPSKEELSAKIAEQKCEIARLRSHIHSLRVSLRTAASRLGCISEKGLIENINELLHNWEKGIY